MLRAAARQGDIVAVSRTPIPTFLKRVRTLVYQHEARRALFYAVAAVAAIALVLPLLGIAFGASRATALAVLGLGGLIVVLLVVGGVVLGVVAPRRRWGGDPELARWVGIRRREVASDLLSAVELANAPVRPGAPSPALVDALIEATSLRLGNVDPVSLLEPGELRRARRWATLALVANLTLVATAPRMVADGWRSLVSARSAPFDGAKLSTVPLVGDLEATLTFPAYSRRPKLPLPSSSGDVRGLPGTGVALKARVLVPAATAELIIEPVDRGEPRVIAAKLDGDQLTAELTIDHSARYRFAITSPSGERAIEAAPRAIEAEPDQAPAVQLMAPADPLDVSNLRRVELAYVIEDDFGITSAELVWESGKDKGKKPIPVGPIGPVGETTRLGTTSTAGTAGTAGAAGAAAPARGRVQGKLMWDIAEVQVPSGGEVRYWIEAKDNDTVGGPNVGRSRELHQKVVSPRERHEETLGRQQDLAEKVLKNLGGRLTLGDEERSGSVGGGAPDGSAAGAGVVPRRNDASSRDDIARQLREAIVELGTIGAAFEKDPHASDALRKALSQMRERLDKLAITEQRLLPKGKPPARGQFAALDPRMIGELEDDALVLADWLDRERLEGLLDLSDEIAAHQKRLADLLAQYQRTKDPRLLDEIEREMRTLDRAFAELDKHRRGMAEDVLDQYVHKNAVQAQAGTGCIDEVRKLVRAGDPAKAQAKLDQCRQQQGQASSALEGSLAGLRGDKFTDEQKKLDEVMNELSDIAKDQDDIAAEANRIFEAYAEKADEVARDHRREASKKVAALLDKLRRRLHDINESGLTPFAKEELDIVERRLSDVEHMVGDGDLAEALGMAHQASQSLDTIAGELEAAINDDPRSKWADATQDALDGVSHARPVAKELIDELQSLSPKPDQIMSADDHRALDRLRRREAVNKDRAKRLSDRAKQLGGELPGDAAPELGKRLGGAIEQMGAADERMKVKDPSGARAATRAAADSLAKARDRARSAARQAQEGAVGDEPIRIPGADEYRAPERFREDLLEAMKKKGAVAPEGYDEQIKRYYEELIR
jgi:predicted transcriptional regulator